MTKTLYEVIGVNSNADVKEIESKCIELGKKYHPKNNPDNLEAAITYKEIMLAYTTLRNPDKRSAYDKNIKNDRASFGAIPKAEIKPLSSNNIKAKASSALSWVCGILAIFLALIMTTLSFISGFTFLIVGLMLLPPARDYAYSKTKIALTGNYRAFTITSLLVLNGYFLISSSEKATEEDAIKEAQHQSSSLAANKQKNIKDFENNSAAILEKVRKLIDEKKYAEALAASTKYLSSNDIELKKLHGIAYEHNKKEKTEKVLLEIAKTPESDLSKLAELYSQLASINPEISEYKEKNKSILNTIEWNKSKETLAQQEVKREQKSSAKTPDELKTRIVSTWKSGIKDILIDPDSADFKNYFFVLTVNNTPFACGLVNSKNRLGGYTGFKRFITAGLSEYTYMEDETEGFNEYWKQVCVEGLKF